MTEWLSRPYPHIEDTRLKVAISLAMGLVCFIFLLIFQPFGIHSITGAWVPAVLGFGINCTIILLLCYVLLPIMLPQWYKLDRWTIGHEILFFTAVILLLGLLNYLYNSTILAQRSPQYSVLEFVFMTLAVGVLPIFMMTYITEKVAAQRNKEEAESYNIDSRGSSTEISHTTIYTLYSPTVKSETLKISLQDFVYARSAGNYIEIYYHSKESHSLQKYMMRLSLRGLLEFMDHHPLLLRCHKSYVVNKSMIQSVDGNARSLFIKLAGAETEIPVSRTFDRALLM